MNSAFRKGFIKSAAHVLAEMTYHCDDNEQAAERQAILERSYAEERGEDPDQEDNKIIVETPTAPSKDPAYASYFN